MSRFIIALITIFQLNLISAKAQSALQFNGFPYAVTCETNTAIYYSTGNVIMKSDYQGQIEWSKSFPGNFRIKYEEGFLYGFNGREVIKLDTTGILLWVKTISNDGYISDLIINRNKIFAAMHYTIVSVVYHPGVITMDTAGNHINTWQYPPDAYGLGYEIGVKSSDGGAWVAFRDGGASSAYTSVKIDSAGNVDTSVPAYVAAGGQTAFLYQTLHRGDSSHFMIGSAGDFGGFYGVIYWQRDQADTSAQIQISKFDSLYRATEIQSAALDNMNNLYFLGWTMVDNEIFIAKMDSAGNILLSKSWSSAMLQAYNMSFYPNNRIIYGNGLLYIPCMIDSQFSLVVLDTSLNSPCYGPDKVINLSSTIYFDTGHPALAPDYLSSSFTDSLLTISNITLSNASQICQPTFLTEINFSELRVYPNPAVDEIVVEGLDDPSAFKLYDRLGRTHKTNWFIQDEHVKIDLSGIAPDVYLLTDGRAWVRVLKVGR